MSRRKCAGGSRGPRRIISLEQRGVMANKEKQSLAVGTKPVHPCRADMAPDVFLDASMVLMVHVRLLEYDRAFWGTVLASHAPRVFGSVGPIPIQLSVVLPHVSGPQPLMLEAVSRTRCRVSKRVQSSVPDLTVGNAYI